MTKTTITLGTKTNETTVLEIIVEGAKAGFLSRKGLDNETAAEYVNANFRETYSGKYVDKGILARLFNSYGRKVLSRKSRDCYQVCIN